MVDNQQLVFRLNQIAESIGMLRGVSVVLGRIKKIDKQDICRISQMIREKSDQASMDLQIATRLIFEEKKEDDQQD